MKVQPIDPNSVTLTCGLGSQTLPHQQHHYQQQHVQQQQATTIPRLSVMHEINSQIQVRYTIYSYYTYMYFKADATD